MSEPQGWCSWDAGRSLGCSPPQRSSTAGTTARHPSLHPHPALLSTRFTKIQNTKMTMKRDGISSLQYRLVEISRQPMYTNITVEIGRPPPRLARG